MKAFAGIDLGTTNLKVALYDEDLRPLDSESFPVTYMRNGANVEFDADVCFDHMIDRLSALIRRQGVTALAALAMTGQAETLILVDEKGRAMAPAISWMDERSQAQCALLSRRFSAEAVEAVTGQLSMLPTWPATKLVWLRQNRPSRVCRAISQPCCPRRSPARTPTIRRLSVTCASSTCRNHTWTHSRPC